MKSSTAVDNAGAKAASLLRSRISAGKLKPGTKLSEIEYAQALDISRNTLREAFMTLAAESLVEKIPNRGVYVARPTLEDVREIYQTRLSLEAAAVLWGRPTPALNRSQEKVLQAAVAALEADDQDAMADANQLFHQGLMTMAGSASLNLAMERLLASMRLVFHTMATVPEFHRHYVHRNVEVWELVMQDRPQEAAEYLRAYLCAARDELLQHMTQDH